MLKLIYIFLVFTVLPQSEAVGEACGKPSDCSAGECCKMTVFLRGKRQVSRSGVCEPLGTSGSSCYVSPLMSGSGILYNRCPCDNDHTCQGTGFTEIPYGESGVCEAKEKICSSADDCAADECCVSLNRPRGRKRRSSLSICKKMTTVENVCLLSYGSGRPNGTVFMCPCVDGLTCEPNGDRDFPLGALGTCQLREKPCDTVDDCGSNECCVSLNRPKGRRRRSSLNVCKDMSTIGDVCLVSYGSGRPLENVYMCPCFDGLTCTPNGQTDFPLGDLGTCSDEVLPPSGEEPSHDEEDLLRRSY